MEGIPGTGGRGATGSCERFATFEDRMPAAGGV